jgi:hypothetical protein
MPRTGISYEATKLKLDNTPIRIGMSAPVKASKSPATKPKPKAPAKPPATKPKAAAKPVSEVTSTGVAPIRAKAAQPPKAKPAPPAIELLEDTLVDEAEPTEDEQRLQTHFKGLGEISPTQRILLLKYLDLYQAHPGHEEAYATPRDVWINTNHVLYTPWSAYMDQMDMEMAARMLSITYKCQGTTPYTLMLASWIARQLEKVERHAELVELVRLRKV